MRSQDLIEDELGPTERSRTETPADEDCPELGVVRDLEGGQQDVRDGRTADHHPVPQPALQGGLALLPGHGGAVGGQPADRDISSEQHETNASLTRCESGARLEQRARGRRGGGGRGRSW